MSSQKRSRNISSLIITVAGGSYIYFAGYKLFHSGCISWRAGSICGLSAYLFFILMCTVWLVIAYGSWRPVKVDNSKCDD